MFILSKNNDNELRNTICLYILKKKATTAKPRGPCLFCLKINELRNKEKKLFIFFFRFVGNAWEFPVAECVPKSGLKLTLYINKR